MRSALFIPADNERKLQKAPDCGADVVIFDLEDSVHDERKQVAREILGSYLKSTDKSPGTPQIYVRINALDSGLTSLDLEAVLSCNPDGIVQPKTQDGNCVKTLSTMMTQLRQQAGITGTMPKILVIATETPLSLVHMHTYGSVCDHLSAMTWGAEDLSAELGATTNRDEQGVHTGPYQLARSLCLAGAVAAGLQPIDTVYPDFRNEEGLRKEAREAARDGFTGKLAIHPAQVAIINEVFTPSAQDIGKARAIIAAFAAEPQAGVVNIDGEMYDIPHLTRAQRLLARVHSGGEQI
jgi:citrate lyase subunit beta / citryl-CoA lyase